MAQSLRIDVGRALWMTEKDVVESLSLNEAIDALDEMLIEEGNGHAANVDKSLGTWNGQSSMHALGSMMPMKGYIGFKTWANTPNGAAALFSLFDANDGQLLAMIEAGALGQMRTAGISGIATRALADAAAEDMAVIGTGAQSLMQVAAVAATRKLKSLRFYSRSADKRAAYKEQAQKLLTCSVEEATSVEDAVRGARIVTLITRAREPFLEASSLSSGTHLNAAGAILPGNAEFEQAVFDRSTVIVVDSLPNVRKASTEFRQRFGDDDVHWREVRSLASVLAKRESRPAGADLTLFKPMGMGLSDLAVAIAAYERASASGRGTWLSRGPRSSPRWQAMA